MSAGRTVSIRVEAGVPEQIRAAFGMKFSTFARLVIYAALEQAKQSRRLSEVADAQAAAKAAVEEVAGES